MAWLSNNNFLATDNLHAVDMNNLSNDIRNWGGDVNGGGFNLYNCTISGVFTDPTTTVGDLIVHGPTAGTVGALQRLPIVVGDGLALVIDHTQPLGVKWGVAAGGMLDPTTTKGDLIVKAPGAPPTRLPVGADSHILICDSSQNTGLRWGTITGFAAPGLDMQVMVNQAGVPGASPNLVFNYSKGHLLVGGGADDLSQAVLQVTGMTHTTMRVRSDMFFSPKSWPSSSSLSSPDGGYGGIGYQNYAIYWFWNGASYIPVDFSKLGNILSDPTQNLGDLIVRGSSGITNFPVGPNGYQLVSDNTQTSFGLRWQAPPALGVTSFIGRTGAVIAQAGDYNVSMVTNAVDSTALYSNPPWITSFPWSKITGAPIFLVDPTSTKGDLITRTTTKSARLGVGSDGQFLTADSTQANGLRWASPSTTIVTTISPGLLSGDIIFTAGPNVTLSQITNSSGQQIQISVPNINSSTGMSDPTTTQGDLIVHGLTLGTTRLPLGANGQILTVDNTVDFGCKWAAPASFVGVSSLSPGALTGAVTLLGGTNVLVSQSGQNITIGVPSVLVDPTKNPGDLIVRGSTMLMNLPVGANGSTLIADNTVTGIGMRWGTSSSSQSPWLGNVDAAGYSLNNAGSVNATTINATGVVNGARSIMTSTHLKADAAVNLGDPTAAFIEFRTSEAANPLTGYIQLYTDPTVANRRLAISATDNSIGWQNVTLCETGGLVGIHTASPTAPLDVNGLIRSTNVSAYPTSGLGVESYYVIGSGGFVVSYDRGAGVFHSLEIDANPVIFNNQGGVGYVGVGTGSPQVPFDCVGAIRAVNTAGLQVPSTGMGLEIRAVGGVGKITSFDRSAAAYKMTTITGSPLTLNSDSGITNPNVGIGTTSPLSTLTVQANATINSANTASGQLLISTADPNQRLNLGYDSGSNVGWIQAARAGTAYEPLLLNPFGANVGIGTTSPANQLTIIPAGTPSTPATCNQLAIGESSNNSGNRISLGFGAISTYYTGVIQVLTSGVGTNAVLSLNPLGGNVGIGVNTTVPTTQLQVCGAAGTAAPVQGGGTIYAQANDGGVGVGGALILGHTTGFWSGIKAYISNSSGNTVGHLVFYTRRTTTDANLTEAIRIIENGYVGISKSSPGYPLDITGSCNITGQYLVNGVALATGGITTKNVVTASRAYNTVYQNTSGKPMFVASESVVATGSYSMGLEADTANPPAVYVCLVENTSSINTSMTVSGWVMPGEYYRIYTNSGTAVGFWIEWT